MRPLKKFVLVVTPFGLAACASVWGFEDAVDRPADGGTQAQADGGPVAVGEVTESDVAGVFCAPRPPEGWQGPLSIYSVTSSPLPELPPCVERFDALYEGRADPKIPNDGCGCECDPSTVAKDCVSPVLNFYNEATCTTACGAPNQAIASKPPNQCAAFDATGCASKFVKITSARPGGACTPKAKGGPAAVTWGTEVRLCRSKADVVATCPSDKSIAPATSLPYEPGNYCIASRTATDCPDTYPRKRTYFDADKFRDERVCTSCACNDPTGTCGGIVTSGDKTTPDCGGNIVSMKQLPVPCMALKDPDIGIGYWHNDAGVGTPSCTPSGGQVQGNVEPSAPITVCCRL